MPKQVGNKYSKSLCCFWLIEQTSPYPLLRSLVLNILVWPLSAVLRPSPAAPWGKCPLFTPP